MVDEDLVLRVCTIAGVHDETREMTNAIDPEWVAMEVTWRSLELDKCSGLVVLTIKDNLLYRLVILIILNKSAEKLVYHTTLHAVCVTGLGALLEMLNASLDQVS